MRKIFKFLLLLVALGYLLFSINGFIHIIFMGEEKEDMYKFILTTISSIILVVQERLIVK